MNNKWHKITIRSWVVNVTPQHRRSKRPTAKRPGNCTRIITLLLRQLKSSKQSPTPTKYYPMLISVGTMMLQVTRTAAVQALAVAGSVGSQLSSNRSSVAVAVAGPCRVHVVDKTH